GHGKRRSLLPVLTQGGHWMRRRDARLSPFGRLVFASIMTCPEVRAGMRRRAASSGKAAKQGRRKSGKSRAAPVPAPRLAELEKRLSEALRQRAATSEVLEIISSSERELKPVFQAILKNAVRLCEAKFGNLLLIDGQTARWAAAVGTPPKLARYLQSPSYRPTQGSH